MRASTTIIIVAMLLSLVSGCTSSPQALRYSQSEVERIPLTAKRKLLLSGSNSASIVVKAPPYSGPLTVQRSDDDEHVVIANAKGAVSRLAIREISEIYRVYHLKQQASQSTPNNTEEAVGETLIYAPLIPVAVVSWPVLSSMGLDEHRNSEDREKALLLYQGMTRSELETVQGKPVEKYNCLRQSGKGTSYELWGYDKNKVIRSARYLFINLNDGKVGFASFRMPGWLECSPIK